MGYSEQRILRSKYLKMLKKQNITAQEREECSKFFKKYQRENSDWIKSLHVEDSTQIDK